MKAAEHKPASISPVQKKSETPFFDHSSETETPFFAPKESVGNDAFFSSTKPASIQTKLSIGQPNDKYEQEADSVADKVVQRLSKTTAADDSSISNNSSINIQSKCSACGGEDHEHVQRKASNTEGLASPNIESSLNSSKGGGSPLPDTTQTNMESVIGADFSNVRVHTDSHAVQMSQDLSAHAFTHGNDVYFNEGKYNPQSSDGQHLLAHELTHTVQQSGMINKKIQRQALQCTQLLNNPSVMSNLSGTLVHQLIAADFNSKVGGSVSVGIPGGSAAPLRTQGICGQDSPIIPPQIIGGRAGMGFPDLARNKTSILEIAEIKPADYTCVVDGEQQLIRYLQAGNAQDAVATQWRLSNLVSSVVPMLTSTYTPPALTYGGFQIQTAWCNPGLMVYKVTMPQQRTVPIPVPVPVPVPQVSPQEQSKWQRIKNFVQQLIDSGGEIETVIRQFLLNNPDLINFIIYAGIGLIVATIAEDIITAGIGIIDDFIMIPIATAMIRIAMSLQQYTR